MTADALSDFVSTLKRVEFVAALPLTSLDKVDKKALRERYWTGLERQV